MDRSSSPFFVVCTGRCGTSTLVKMLRMHPSICAMNAPRPHLSVESYAKWSTPWKKNKIENKIRRKRTNLIEQIINNNYIYVEASNYCANLIQELDNIFHNSRFIHLYCDGRDFVSRGLDKDWYKKMPFKYELQSWVRRRFIVDIGRTRIDHQLPPPKKLKSRLEKIAWLWTEINRVIIHYLSNIPFERRFSIKLEDLGKDMIIKLHNFLGVEVIPDVLNNMITFLNKVKEQKTPVSYPYEIWSDDEKIKFEDIAGEMMYTLGYNCNYTKEAKII